MCARQQTGRETLDSLLQVNCSQVRDSKVVSTNYYMFFRELTV